MALLDEVFPHHREFCNIANSSNINIILNDIIIVYHGRNSLIGEFAHTGQTDTEIELRVNQLTQEHYRIYRINNGEYHNSYYTPRTKIIKSRFVSGFLTTMDPCGDDVDDSYIYWLEDIDYDIKRKILGGYTSKYVLALINGDNIPFQHRLAYCGKGHRDD